jgi:signal transduction histidine kinase
MGRRSGVEDRRMKSHSPQTPLRERLRQQLLQLVGLLKETTPAPEEMARRLRTVERNVVLPVKAAFLLILMASFFASRWFEDVSLPQSVAQRTVEQFFIIYLLFNLVVAAVLIRTRDLPSPLVQRLIFASSFLDGLFLAALAFVTGGFNSSAYWLLCGLIVRNAVSCPLAAPQLLLNLSVSACYLAAGVLDLAVSHDEELEPGGVTEPFLLRLFLLWLIAACCYGVQVVFEKQRRAAEEAREFDARQDQLRAAGRIAAKIAHQIKNPLGIINNAAYSLQRALAEGKAPSEQSLQIIREEVEKADQTITQLMGYARLVEGRVERLVIADEVAHVVELVLPAAAKYPVRVSQDIAPDLPALLMQKAHFMEILTNLLQNARDAMTGRGRIQITARAGPERTVELTVADDGPGIPAGQLEKVFQPYFTTKEKGSGLGLSIVKHNAELYGGTVRVESELGKGARFILSFPTRILLTPEP